MVKELTKKKLWKDMIYSIQGTICNAAIERCLSKEKMNILEVASGSGKLGMNLAIMGHEVTLLDIDKDAIAYSRRLRDAIECLWQTPLELTLVCANFFDSRLPSNMFDLVFTEGFTHHFTDERRQKSVDEMARVSKKWVCIIGSNGLNPEMRKIASETKHDYMGMPERQIPHDPGELTELMARAGLKNIDIMVLVPEGEDSQNQPFGNINMQMLESALLLAGIGEKK